MIKHADLNARTLDNRLSEGEQKVLSQLDEFFSDEIERQFKNDDIMNVSRSVIHTIIGHVPIKRQAVILNALFARCKEAGWQVKQDFDGYYFEVYPISK